MANEPWPQQPSSSLDAILLLHRSPDSYVSFLEQNPQGGLRGLASVRVTELRQKFALLIPHLGEDAYLSVNSFYRAEFRGRNHRLPEFPRACHSAAALRYLNACFVDLDCYRGTCSIEQVLADIQARQQVGTIPRPSLVVRSGRGVWLFWLLRSEPDPALPPRAFSRERALYARIQRTLASRLWDLGADTQALDAARVTRVPGSRNSKAAATVSYWPQRDDGGQLPLYTLPALASILELPTTSTRALRSRSSSLLSERQLAQRRRAAPRRWLHLREDLVALWQSRGGFAQGCRNRAALYYAFVLRCLGTPIGQITQTVRRLAAECRPPLSAREAEKAVTVALGMQARLAGGALSYQRFRADLQVTPQEAVHLHCGKQSASFGPEPLGRPTPSARHTQIQAIIAAHQGQIPPVRRMAALLTEAGFRVQRSTVQRDYGVLQLAPSARQGQRRRTGLAPANCEVDSSSVTDRQTG